MVAIVVAVLGVVLFVAFVRNCGKKGSRRNWYLGNGEVGKSGDCRSGRRFDNKYWLSDLLCYLEGCSVKPRGFDRMHAKIAFINSELPLKRINRLLEGTINGDEIYCLGLVYGYYCRTCYEKAQRAELPTVFEDGKLKQDFDDGVEAGTKIADSLNDTSSRARFR